jgi:type I restriction-modification system DNA methylase subunit
MPDRGGSNMTNHVQNFIKLLDTINYSRNRYEVFNDWLILASSSLYSWKNDPKVEEEYLQFANQYKKEELEQHAKLLEIIVNALEENEQDFLGEVFTFGEFSNENKGQFFTPYHISRFMAEAIIGEKEPQQNRIIKVCEPCCGSGGMLIASASVMKSRGINFQQNAFFYAVDIDARCARMTFIQLSLLGMPAIVVCGNALTNEIFWQRETIGYVMSGMKLRLMAQDLSDGANESDLENIKVQPDPEQITADIELHPVLAQGELF